MTIFALGTLDRLAHARLRRNDQRPTKYTIRLFRNTVPGNRKHRGNQRKLTSRVEQNAHKNAFRNNTSPRSKPQLEKSPWTFRQNKTTCVRAGARRKDKEFTVNLENFHWRNQRLVAVVLVQRYLDSLKFKEVRQRLKSFYFTSPTGI